MLVVDGSIESQCEVCKRQSCCNFMSLVAAMREIFSKQSRIISSCQVIVVSDT